MYASYIEHFYVRKKIFPSHKSNKKHNPATKIKATAVK